MVRYVDVIDIARNSRGATIEIKLTPRSSQPVDIIEPQGFMVSYDRGIEHLPNAALTPELLGAFVAQWRNRFATYPEETFLGLWRDGEGLWSVDVSVMYTHMEAAAMFGRSMNQRAIYDGKNKREIIL